MSVHIYLQKITFKKYIQNYLLDVNNTPPLLKHSTVFNTNNFLNEYFESTASRTLNY